MPNDCPLAEKEVIRLSDLKGLPVIVSRAAEPYFAGSKELSSLNVVATYNLVYNASLLVEDGLGYAICFDKLINTTGESRLLMRPIVPRMEAVGHVIWKKYQVFSPAVQLFIDSLSVRRLVLKIHDPPGQIDLFHPGQILMNQLEDALQLIVGQDKRVGG